MRGITVVGSGLDSGEIGVAAACAQTADAALYVTAAIGADADAHAGRAEHALRTPASPVIAARHGGIQFEPPRLVSEVRALGEGGPVVVGAPGGFLSSLTENYSVRDFARELGLPIVIAARASGGVTGHVRLVAEAARAAGLAVATAVLTEWPEPPSRVQLDERDLLAKIARFPVETLAGGGIDAVPWPVGSWMETEAVAAPAAAAAPEPEDAPAAPVVMDSYDAWVPRQVGDPRSTPRPQIMQTMLEIVEAEGPMTATRAYSLYNRAAGGRKLTSVAKAPLSSAVYWLAREQKLTLTREEDIPWQGDDMIRLPDQPPVRVRELGPRSLDEVPLDEIAELVRLIRGTRGAGDPTEVKRTILQTYRLVRLTARADEYLGLAIDLAG